MFPFWFGSLGNRSGYPQQQRASITAQKLRKFSRSPIPRRLINYLRGQVSRLRWGFVPVVDRELNQQEKKRLERLRYLLRRPNPDDGWRGWIQKIIEDMLVVGWGPVEVRRLRPREQTDAGDEAPNYALWPFDGASLQVYTDWDGSPSVPRYAQVLPNGEMNKFRNSEIIPFKWTATNDNPFGLAPLEVSIIEVEHLLNANAFAGRTASNANPKKALWIKGLTPEQRQQFKEWWDAEVSGSGTIPMIGGEQAETLELGLITDQNLFLKWQEFLIAIIANAFGIDVQKCNLIVGINRSTGDKLDDVTDEGSVMTLADMIEEYVNQYILPLYDLDEIVEFRFFPAATSDMKAVATLNQVELQDDSITIDEARRRQGLPPLVHENGTAIGKMTLTEYRAYVNSLHTVKPAPDGSNEKSDADTDPAKGGNNGVYGQPTEKDKPLNHADEREDDA